MRVRNAKDTDLGTLLVLNTFVQQQHTDALPRLFKTSTEPQQIKDAFKNFVSDPNSLVLLAEETEPTGYLFAQFQNHPANWARFESKLLYIQHLIVAPKFRRRGIATKLLSAALDAARSRGIGRVELDVWSFNSEAKHFYLKNGFKVFNERMTIATDEAQL
jgi:ribosomal protein S18 acetylase RimI-like enzyme